MYSHTVESYGLNALRCCTSDVWHSTIASNSSALGDCNAKIWYPSFEYLPDIYSNISVSPTFKRVDIQNLELFPVVMGVHTLHLVKIAHLNHLNSLDLTNSSRTPQLAAVVEDGLD